MDGNSIRVSLVLDNKEQFDRWKKQLAEEGFGSFSQMVRSVVERHFEKRKEPLEKSLEPIKNALDALYRQSEVINDKVDTINIRLQVKDENPEVYKAVKEIRNELSKGELTLPEIVGKLNYPQEIVKQALVLLSDIGFITTKRKNQK